MKQLTDKQKTIFCYIQDYIEENGISPSYREIQNHFDYVSLSTVSSHVKALEKKGAISLEKYGNRSIQLNNSSPTENVSYDLTLPLRGTIVAGEPISFFELPQTVCMPHYLVPSPENSYALKAIGSSLEEELIGNGDILVVEARNQTEEGETTLLLINQNETYIKQLFKMGDMCKLVSRNATIDPFLVPSYTIQIQGVLSSVIRIY